MDKKKSFLANLAPTSDTNNQQSLLEKEPESSSLLRLLKLLLVKNTKIRMMLDNSSSPMLKETLHAWGGGEIIPTTQQLLSFADQFDLSDMDTAKLVQAQIRETFDKEFPFSTALDIVKQRRGIHTATTQIIQMLDDTQDIFGKLNHMQEDERSEQESIIASHLQILEDRMKELEGKSQRLSANIILPKNIEVKMAPLWQLQLFERDRSDQTAYSAVASITFGATVGIAVNWITGETITRVGIVVACLLLAFTIISGVAAFVSSRRARETWREIISKQYSNEG